MLFIYVAAAAAVWNAIAINSYGLRLSGKDDDDTAKCANGKPITFQKKRMGKSMWSTAMAMASTPTTTTSTEERSGILPLTPYLFSIEKESTQRKICKRYWL